MKFLIIFKHITFEWTSTIKANSKGEAIDQWKVENPQLWAKLRDNKSREQSFEIIEIKEN